MGSRAVSFLVQKGALGNSCSPKNWSGVTPQNWYLSKLRPRKGGSYSRKGVFLPSKCLVESPFLEPLLRTFLRTLLPSKTHLVRTLLRTFSKAVSRTLPQEPFLEGVLSRDPLGVHPKSWQDDGWISHPIGVRQKHLHYDFLLFLAFLLYLYRGLTKGWFPKGWFWRMFPRNENRNKGTFTKTTLLRNLPFISQ